MAIFSEDDQNNDDQKWRYDDICRTKETISTKRSRQSTETLKSSPTLQGQPLPTIPFDLIPEILSRIPIKPLLQLRCVCKSWNYLIISDPEFCKKQFRKCSPTCVNDFIAWMKCINGSKKSANECLAMKHEHFLDDVSDTDTIHFLDDVFDTDTTHFLDDVSDTDTTHFLDDVSDTDTL